MLTLLLLVLFTTNVYSQEIPASATPISIFTLTKTEILNPGDTVYTGVATGSQAFEYIYTKMGDPMPGRNVNLRDQSKAICTIESLFLLGNDVYAAMKTTVGSYLYAPLKAAISTGELEVTRFNRVSKYLLYHKYLQTIKEVGDNTAVCYINTFEKPDKKLNEFDQRRMISSSKQKVESIKRQDMREEGVKLYFSAEVGNYDFTKKAFPVPNAAKARGYQVKLEDGVTILAFSTENLDEDITIPVDESKAEEITTKYLSQGSRTLYFVYRIKLTKNIFKSFVDSNVYNVQGASIGKKFVQFGYVTRIDVYSDEDYTNKLASVNL